jgi:hypothetical protein
MKPTGVTLCVTAVLAMTAACDRPPDLAASALRPVPFEIPDTYYDWSAVWEAEYSPDGRKVAFLATWDDETRVATVQDGATEATTLAGYEVHSFAWLPGSDEILTAHTDPDDPWFSPDDLGVWEHDGGFIREVGVDQPFVASDGLTVSPDGRFAVAAATKVPGTAGYDVDADLLLIALDWGYVRKLTATPEFHEHSPEFVAARRIVFGRRGGGDPGSVMSLDLTSGRERRLSPPDHAVVDVTAVRGTVLYSVDSGGFGGDTNCYWRLNPSLPAPTPLFCFPSRFPDLGPDGRSLLLNVDPTGEVTQLLGFGDSGRIVEVAL